MNKKRVPLLLIVVVVILAGALFIWADRAGAPTNNEAEPAPDASTNEAEADDSGFDRSLYSIDEPGSPWWIVNRERPLPDGYVPPDLTVPDVRLRLGAGEEQMQFSQQAVPALEDMFAAAGDDGVELVFGSGYRSEQLQAQFYNSYVERDGQEAADRYSARPGTSEHQTGLAVDITTPSGECHLEVCFEDLPQGQWLSENAHRYGFIIRYPEGKEDITGYQYEPWHLRYVGEELATELYETGQTMEEFFDVVGYMPQVLAYARMAGCTCCC